eukprot:scaffold577_cov273-Chaetoceros_neogracile.AAC.7
MQRTKLLHQKLRQNANQTVHIAGHGWTGALGTGTDTMTESLTSSVTPTQRENEFTSLPGTIQNVTRAAAGWGHTVLATRDHQLHVAGRPYDFHTLLRLYRMPSMIRRFTVMQSLMMEKKDEPGILGRIVDSVFRNSKNPDGEKEESYHRAIIPEFREIFLPDGDLPKSEQALGAKTLAASAGLTAIVGESGKLYTFGLNQRGQCGNGDRKAHHVWEPRTVLLKEDEDEDTISGHALENITQVALGLQHGLALNEDGLLFGWGKGARGQLGQSRFKTDKFEDGREPSIDIEYGAIPIDEFELFTEHSRSTLSGNDSRVRSMSAGWNHSGCITESNHAFVWGKNVLAKMKDAKLMPVDSPNPTWVQGLPRGMEIKLISCGSHHTSFLMEDNSVYAIGIATDSAEPLGETAVQIVPPGLIDSPITQFSSHFDRTTIVAGDGGKEQQVLEMQMWSTEDLRSAAVFEPEWLETLTRDGSRVEVVERGWMHTVVLTSS